MTTMDIAIHDQWEKLTEREQSKVWQLVEEANLACCRTLQARNAWEKAQKEEEILFRSLARALKLPADYFHNED